MNMTLNSNSPDSASTQVLASGVDGAAAPIFDRYATSIIKDNRRLYDSLEVHGVRDCSAAGDGGTQFEIDNCNPTSFSVYAHLIDGGVDCVGDFSLYSDAVQYGDELAVEYGWPIRNYVLDQHRAAPATLQ